jgi:hypothetical protein
VGEAPDDAAQPAEAAQQKVRGEEPTKHSNRDQRRVIDADGTAARPTDDSGWVGRLAIPTIRRRDNVLVSDGGGAVPERRLATHGHRRRYQCYTDNDL